MQLKSYQKDSIPMHLTRQQTSVKLLLLLLYCCCYSPEWQPGPVLDPGDLLRADLL